MARRIWMRRNELVHIGKFIHPTQLLREAEAALEDFQRINNNPKQHGSDEGEQEPVRWQPPPRGMIKINWDAALDLTKKKIGLGIVARDDRGSFMAAYSKNQAIEVNPVVAEALAALHAVIFCQEQGY